MTNPSNWMIQGNGTTTCLGQPTEGNIKKRLSLRHANDQHEREIWRAREERQENKCDPCIIFGNLQALMKSQGLSMRETIMAICKDGNYEPKEYRWLKRVAAKGIVQTDKRTMARLEKLAELFGVTVEQLRRYDLNWMLIYKEFNQPDFPGFSARYASMLEQLLSDKHFSFIEAVLLAAPLGH